MYDTLIQPYRVRITRNTQTMHNPKIEPKRFTKKVKINNIIRKRYTSNHKTVIKKIINTYLHNNIVSLLNDTWYYGVLLLSISNRI